MLDRPALVVPDTCDDDSPLRSLVLGLDFADNILEMIVLHSDDGRDMAIGAMSMRSHCRGLLPRSQKT